MKTGVIFPSYVHEATVTGSAGWSADYPKENVIDLLRPSKVARVSATGAQWIILTFPALRPLRGLAVVGHSAVSGSIIIDVTDGPNQTGSNLYSSPVLDLWPAGSAAVPGYRSIRPVLFPSQVMARSVQVYFSNPGIGFEVQAIEVGGLWEWPGIGFGRELGGRADNGRLEYAGGAADTPGRRVPTRVRGDVDLMKMSITSTTGLDFQKGVDIQKPFVWAEDFDDPTTWARKCLLVRNEEVSPMAGALYRHDRFPVGMIEHLR